MSTHATGRPVHTAGKARRRVLVAIAVLIAVGVLSLLLLCRGPSVDEQLAAIEASRAIPDAENAAVLYQSILDRWGSVAPQSAPADRSAQTRPWRSEDNPELAWWLDQQQEVLAEFRKAAEREQCRLPLWIDWRSNSPPRLPAAMRDWAVFMARSINRDFGDGRIDSAFDTCRCLGRLGEHLRQQPTIVHYLLGSAIEGLMLSAVRTFIVAEPAATDDCLDRLESVMSSPEDTWEQDRAQRVAVEELLRRKDRSRQSLLERLKTFRGVPPVEAVVERVDELARRGLAHRRGISILIALRRHRNHTGAWPASLDEIASTLPPETLVDPRNGGPFMYKLIDRGFVLYSTGPDRIDQTGVGDRGADDWPIWLGEEAAEPGAKQGANAP